MPSRLAVKPGWEYGRLVVLSVFVGKVLGTTWNNTFARCRCQCGSMVVVTATELRSGKQKSCSHQCPAAAADRANALARAREARWSASPAAPSPALPAKEPVK
jgi:hypothetical protein